MPDKEGITTFVTFTPEVKKVKSNFTLQFDDMGLHIPYLVIFHFTVKKTVKARIKYWLFCQFFPFKIVKWE